MVVGQQETMSENGRRKLYNPTEYLQLCHLAVSDVEAFIKHAGQRLAVKGDGWCWAYALSSAMGIHLDHAVAEPLDEHEQTKPVSGRDRAIVTAFIEMLQVYLVFMFTRATTSHPS